MYKRQDSASGRGRNAALRLARAPLGHFDQARFDLAARAANREDEPGIRGILMLVSAVGTLSLIHICDVRAMVFYEAAYIGGLGGLTGVAAGVLLALLLIFVISQPKACRLMRCV